MNNKIRLSFVGDLMCQKEQSHAAMARHGAYRYEEAFAPVRSLFEKSAYVIGNLETPLAGESFGYSDETFRFNSPDSFLDAIQSIGVSFVSTANNHILDRGIRGLEETLHCLDRHGMEHSGTYLSAADSERIFIKEIGGIKIALLSFTYGTNSESYGDPLPKDEEWRVDLLRKQPAKTMLESVSPTLKSHLQRWLPLRIKVALSALGGKTQRQVPDYVADNVHPKEINCQTNNPFLERARAKILRAKELADVVIILPHIGGQYNPSPGEYSKWTMQWIADLGADLIVANHPHVPLRCGRFENGCLGAYALGNFCFNPSDGCFVPNQLAEYGIVMQMDISTSTRKITEVFFQVVKTTVEPDGFATVHPVHSLIESTRDPLARQKLLIENEAVVNRFRGSAGTVLPLDAYPLPLSR